MRALFSDAWYALRLLRTSRAFALVTTLTLAVGIGATTAMFSVVDGVLIQRFPVEDEGRLLVVWTSIPSRGFEHWPFSYAGYEGIRDRLHTASGVAAHPYSGAVPAVVRLDDGSAVSVQRATVTGEWFGVLGVRPQAGRLLTPADDTAGAAHVVVLSSAFARQLFGSPGGAIGRRIRFPEATFTVVGVTPAGFEYPRTTEAWLPAVLWRQSPYVAWDLVVRIAPGFTAAQAAADLDAALANLPHENGPLGDVGAAGIIRAQSFADTIVGSVRPSLLMLGIAVLLVLIVAGVNVACLLLARGVTRRREMSVRAAIGATRGRLVRQLAAEAFVLVAVGAGLAIFVATVALHGLLLLVPADVPRVAGTGIDARALAFAIVVAIVTAVLCGVLPALGTARADPADALRPPLGTATGGRRGVWLRHGLVMAQIAIAMLVLSGAALLLASFDRMRRLDVGFAAEHLLLAEIAIPPSRYQQPADHQRGMVRLAEHAATLPGVSDATAVTMAPFAGTQGVDATVFGEGQALGDSAAPIVNYEAADASYFGTLGVRILRGRGIGTQDRTGSQPVAVVNEAFARLFWPGREAIGRRIKWGTSRSDSPWLTVVGVAADTRYRELTVPRPTVYVPYPHGIPVTPGYLAVRGSNPIAAAAAIRRAVTDREPGATILRIDSITDLLAAPLARPRFQATLAMCFAAAALLLSIVGVYGMLALLVRQRTREIGIRMAIGASPADVRRLVLGQGVALGGGGVLIGTVLALALSRAVQPLLFGMSATDPRVLLATAVVLLGAVLAAAMLPTRMAMRTDPLVVLRSQ